MIRNLGVLSTVLVVLCLSLSPLHAEESATLNLGHVGHDHQIALYVAANQGRALEATYGVYLEPLKDREVYDLHDRGRKVARVHFIKVGGGSDMPAAMERGDIDVGLGGLAAVAKFADKGTPLKVIAPLNNDGDSLVVGKTIQADSWDGFVKVVKASDRPVKIGYKAPMAVAFMILTKALNEEGVTYGSEPVGKDGKPVQVMLVNLQGDENMVPSLEAGVVDAVVANEPAPSILVEKGVGRRIADLSHLPPRGKWEGHPCCIVAATDSALKNKREAVVSLLRVIVAGGDLMAVKPDLAYRAESRWTKTPAEVARQSVPNVSYVIRPDAKWQAAVDTWLDLMLSMKRFDKTYAGQPPKAIRESLVDLGPMNEALSGMKLQSAK